MFRKLTSMVLAGVMALSVMASVTAADVNQSGGSGDSKVTLDINSRNLKVTVPSVLPIWVDSDNNVTVATNAKIQNRSEGPVDVTDVSVEADNNWSLVDFNTDFTKVPVDTKQYGMTMYNDDVIDGVDLSLFDRINGSDEIAVQYNGNVAIQSSDINKLDIGHVVFTVAWADGERLGVNDITYNVENPKVGSYLAHAAYDSADTTTTYITDGWAADKQDLPGYGILEVPDGCSQITILSSDGKSFTDTVSGDEYHVDSLIPGEVYDYQMKDSSDNVVKQGKIYPTGMLRMINLRNSQEWGVMNVRDLGGWNADGGKLKYGMLYRGSEIDGGAYGHTLLNNVDKAKMTSFLGIQAELDLRSDGETDGTGLSAIGVEYNHITPALPYKSFLTSTLASSEVQYVIDCVKSGKPLYIHCAAGADRTGTLMCIIEALCGVSESDIDRDYELSLYGLTNGVYPNNYVDGLYTRLYTKYLEFKNQIKSSYNGNTFSDKVLRFAVTQLDLSIDDINALRNGLIDGAPRTIVESDIYGTWSDDLFVASNASLNTRINSSGNEVAASGMLVTDYFSVTNFSEFKVESDVAQDFANVYKVIFYDENKQFLGFGGPVFNNDDKLSYSVSSYQANTKYVRFTIKYTDINNIHVYER